MKHLKQKNHEPENPLIDSFSLNQFSLENDFDETEIQALRLLLNKEDYKHNVFKKMLMEIITNLRIYSAFIWKVIKSI